MQPVLKGLAETKGGGEGLTTTPTIYVLILDSVDERHQPAHDL